MEGSHSGLSLLLINFSVIAAYLVLNSSLNIIMRYTLGIYGQLSFPNTGRALPAYPCGVQHKPSKPRQSVGGLPDPKFHCAVRRLQLSPLLDRRPHAVQVSYSTPASCMKSPRLCLICLICNDVYLSINVCLFPSFTMLAPLMAFEPFLSKHRATLHKQWKGLMAIGAFMALNIALNNLSLVEITLSLNQVIRCSSCILTLSEVHVCIIPAVRAMQAVADHCGIAGAAISEH